MNIKQRKMLSEATDVLRILYDAEIEKYESIPDNLQGSDKAELFLENADRLEEAIGILEEIE